MKQNDHSNKEHVYFACIFGFFLDDEDYNNEYFIKGNRLISE